MQLKPETLAKIDGLIPRYPDKRSCTLPLCHLVQEDQGYLSDEAIEWIAAKLDLQPIQVFEVVTFYPMFRRKPVGKVHVKVCRTLSCALNGAYKVCEHLEEALECPRGGTSPDNNYTVEFVECIAGCGQGPVVQVDDCLYQNITPEKAPQLVETIRQRAQEATSDTQHPKAEPAPGTPAFHG